MALTPKPQIDQIKIKDKTYDINVPKSWAQNDPTHVQYIKDRTHYQELLTGADIPPVEINAAQYSFKNIYRNGNQVYSDNWVPQQSWIYAGLPCQHNNIAAHINDSSCSGGWYKVEFSALSTIGTETTAIPLYSGKIWIYPFRSTGETSNQVQVLVNLESIENVPDAWKNCKLCYNTNGFFYITGEPTSEENKDTFSSSKNTFSIKPVTDYDEKEGYRRYLYTKRIDSTYLPLDGKTILRDSNGNLTAEDIYVSNFRVTEQFGRYEPLEWVPAEGRSVKDVLNDAFCTDQLPSALEPSIELYVKTPETHYEVGSEIDLDWAFRLKKGSYTYGLVNANKESIVEKDGSAKAYSNYFAKSFEVTVNTTTETSENNDITFTSFAFEGEFNDDCRTMDDAGTNYRTLKQNDLDEDKKTTIKLPKDPITRFTMSLEIVGDLDKQYSAATMLGDISNPLVEFKNYSSLTNTTLNILTSDYRWFWTYSDGEANEDPNSNTIREYSNQLSGFPSTITTDKMRSMCFFIPKARAKYTEATAPAILETSITVQNEATGASACLEMLNKEVTVKDIGGNDHKYLMYYFTNDAQDSGTNTYEIIINDLKEEGGNS